MLACSAMSLAIVRLRSGHVTDPSMDTNAPAQGAQAIDVQAVLQQMQQQAAIMQQQILDKKHIQAKILFEYEKQDWNDMHWVSSEWSDFYICHTWILIGGEEENAYVNANATIRQ